MKLEKLSLQGYTKDDFKETNGDPFEVMINPSSYDHSYTIGNKTQDVPGNSAQTVTFSTVKSETVKFDFILDDTGIVKKNGDNKGKSVSEMIESLKKVVYNYEGEEHRPNFVIVKWASLHFKCCLDKMSVNYQMFKPSGDPLRAKISLEFLSTISPKNEAQDADRQSPDMTHIVTVAPGDTLPSLCNKFYNNSSYYIQVAKHNELDNIVHIEPGSKLHFPPLN